MPMKGLRYFVPQHKPHNDAMNTSALLSTKTRIKKLRFIFFYNNTGIMPAKTKGIA